MRIFIICSRFCVNVQRYTIHELLYSIPELFITYLPEFCSPYPVFNLVTTCGENGGEINRTCRSEQESTNSSTYFDRRRDREMVVGRPGRGVGIRVPQGERRRSWCRRVVVYQGLCEWITIGGFK